MGQEQKGTEHTSIPASPASTGLGWFVCQHINWLDPQSIVQLRRNFHRRRDTLPLPLTRAQPPSPSARLPLTEEQQAGVCVWWMIEEQATYIRLDISLSRSLAEHLQRHTTCADLASATSTAAAVKKRKRDFHLRVTATRKHGSLPSLVCGVCGTIDPIDTSTTIPSPASKPSIFQPPPTTHHESGSSFKVSRLHRFEYPRLASRPDNRPANPQATGSPHLLHSEARWGAGDFAGRLARIRGRVLRAEATTPLAEGWQRLKHPSRLGRQYWEAETAYRRPVRRLSCRAGTKRHPIIDFPLPNPSQPHRPHRKFLRRTLVEAVESIDERKKKKTGSTRSACPNSYPPPSTRAQLKAQIYFEGLTPYRLFTTLHSPTISALH
ncbi:hypothetical protein EJ06DRAFT_413920 [Trichodelitschia bisporula]|uniref:Uncharacterized protein n=1 Tax=Trichodelitschia bisporula TaxID=703511 RepID=A0A6G1HY10_9PEZI|nr:hypothetical protein EJ06DRAFT_413920 [Trichodelitschia bisporula]